MTGRYATRFGYEFTPAHPVFMKMIGEAQYGLRKPIYFERTRERLSRRRVRWGCPHSEITVGKLLQKQGYHTMMFGKWHLGDMPEMQPQAQGFDESLGFLMGAQLYAPAGAPADSGVEAALGSDRQVSLGGAALCGQQGWRHRASRPTNT